MKKKQTYTITSADGAKINGAGKLRKREARRAAAKYLRDTGTSEVTVTGKAEHFTVKSSQLPTDAKRFWPLSA